MSEVCERRKAPDAQEPLVGGDERQAVHDGRRAVELQASQTLTGESQSSFFPEERAVVTFLDRRVGLATLQIQMWVSRRSFTGEALPTRRHDLGNRLSESGHENRPARAFHLRQDRKAAGFELRDRDGVHRLH